jgi:hypothetical protein
MSLIQMKLKNVITVLIKIILIINIIIRLFRKKRQNLCLLETFDLILEYTIIFLNFE